MKFCIFYDFAEPEIPVSRPGKLLTNMQKTLAYTQVAKLPVKVTNGGNEVG